MEQLKKEYKEIPIPENGVAGVHTAMERAMRKKRLKKRMVGFAAMAAAAVFVVAIFPKGMFFPGGSAKNESAGVRYDTMSKGWGGGATASEADGNYGYSDYYNEKVTEDMVINPTSGNVDQESEYGVMTESASAGESVQDYGNPLDKEETRSKISEEIREQIRLAEGEEMERFAEGGVHWSEVASITKEQEYYFNEEGRLVIVFRAGELAPTLHETMEFVIPDEVWK